MVVLASKLLARLLVVNGPSYMRKFADKTGGIVIMQRHLKRWWSIPSVWPICFAVLFGKDIASVDIDRSFDLYNLLEALNAGEGTCVVYPEFFSILASMLQNGFRAITQDQMDPDSPLNERAATGNAPSTESPQARVTHKRSPSMSLKTEIAPLGEDLASTSKGPAISSSLMVSRHH